MHLSEPAIDRFIPNQTRTNPPRIYISRPDTVSELEVVPSPQQRAAAEWSEDSDEDDDDSDDDDGFALHMQDALNGI